MKANNGSGNNESRDIWETPKWLFHDLNRQYHFDLDCCATEKNRKVGDFSNNFLRFRAISLFKCVWMNPPFSKAYDMFEHFFGSVKSGVAIYRCDNIETKIWQDVIFPNCSWVFIPNKRITYEGMEGEGSRFPSALIGFNIKKPIGLQGIILEVVK